MLLERVLRALKKLRILLFENCNASTVRFVARRLRGDLEPMQISFLGRELWIRPGAPDLEVAYSCFSGEFDGLREILDPQSRGIIIDAGGYIGTAAIALSELFPNAEVLTIEPSDKNVAVLRKNIALSPKITAIHGALVPDGHSGPISLVDRGEGQWGFSLGSEYEKGQVDCTGKPFTIAKLLQDTSMDKVFLLKMDIEGAEKALLLKSKDWLPKTEALFIELHPEIHPDVAEVYRAACHGRRNLEPVEEKHLSVRQPT